MTPNEVLTRAYDILQDVDKVRWTQAEMLRWLNDGRRELGIHRPDLFAQDVEIITVDGTEQALPNGSVKLLDVIRNKNGGAVRVCERETLDATLPNWHSATAGATKHFMYDERQPQVFYVYPPAKAGATLIASVALIPADMSADASMGSERAYGSALVDYVCYRALSKDAEFTGNMGRAQMHLQMFMASIGVGFKKLLTGSPNIANKGGEIPRTAMAEQQTGGV